MGICHVKKCKPPSNLDISFTSHAVTKHLDRTIHWLKLQIDLIGDVQNLGGYIQDRIQKLRIIQQQLEQNNGDNTKIQILLKASEIIEFLYADKHFSQAFPILRESLHEITFMTQVSLSPE